MPLPIIAALDLGSNTFRLMLAENRGGVPTAKKVFQHIPRLSENLTNGGHFAPEALKRAWSALDEFDAMAQKAGAEKILAVATMAARLSADGPSFMAEISHRYGWETSILSGDEEAHLTAWGVLSGLDPKPDRAIIFDIGGRSTEFIHTRGGEIVKNCSLPLGVVILTEKYLSDPPQAGQIEAAAMAARQVLRQAPLTPPEAGTVLIGTAGTVTTLAAILLGQEEYAPEALNNLLMNRSTISSLLETIAGLTIQQVVDRYGLHPRRADAMTAGLAFVLEIMDHLNQTELTVSVNCLLEGAWLKASNALKPTAAPSLPNPNNHAQGEK